MPFIGNAKYGAEACDKWRCAKSLLEVCHVAKSWPPRVKKWIIGSGGFVDAHQSRRFTKENCQPNRHRPRRFDGLSARLADSAILMRFICQATAYLLASWPNPIMVF